MQEFQNEDFSTKSNRSGYKDKKQKNHKNRIVARLSIRFASIIAEFELTTAPGGSYTIFKRFNAEFSISKNLEKKKSSMDSQTKDFYSQHKSRQMSH